MYHLLGNPNFHQNPCRHRFATGAIKKGSCFRTHGVCVCVCVRMVLKRNQEEATIKGDAKRHLFKKQRSSRIYKTPAFVFRKHPTGPSFCCFFFPLPPFASVPWKNKHVPFPVMDSLQDQGKIRYMILRCKWKKLCYTLFRKHPCLANG